MLSIHWRAADTTFFCCFLSWFDLFTMLLLHVSRLYVVLLLTRIALFAWLNHEKNEIHFWLVDSVRFGINMYGWYMAIQYKSTVTWLFISCCNLTHIHGLTQCWTTNETSYTHEICTVDLEMFVFCVNHENKKHGEIHFTANSHYGQHIFVHDFTAQLVSYLAWDSFIFHSRRKLMANVWQVST